MTYLNTAKEFDAELESGKYDKSGACKYFKSATNDVMSYDVAKDNAAGIRKAIAEHAESTWNVLSAHVNYYDHNLMCDHTGKYIPALMRE